MNDGGGVPEPVADVALSADDAIQELLDEMVEAGEVSAAVAVIAGPERVLARATAGDARLTSWFDLGSLTKIFTATLALSLDRQGALPLDLPLRKIFPEAPPPLADEPVGNLLRHRAGLTAWYPFYAVCHSPAEVLPRILSNDLLGAPTDTYSDLDLLLYGFAAERVTGHRLIDLLRRQVLEPLGLRSTVPSPGALPQVVPCRLDNGQEVRLAAEMGIPVRRQEAPPLGVVQDGNARFFGGFAAHAGLFAPAEDLLTLAREWLAPGDVLDPERVERALEGGERHGLVWVVRSLPQMVGDGMSAAAFGHTGFPGGSVWIDPLSSQIYVLLAHKTTSMVNMKPWRRRFQGLL